MALKSTDKNAAKIANATANLRQFVRDWEQIVAKLWRNR